MVVNFWASWCTPCLKEIPAFVEFYKENSGHVEILGLDFEPVNLEVIDEFVERFSINYPIFLYIISMTLSITNFGEIVGMPTTLFTVLKVNYCKPLWEKSQLKILINISHHSLRLLHYDFTTNSRWT